MQWGIWSRAAALLLAAALSGCVAGDVNPVTGKTIYAPVSASTEAYYGEKANAKITAEYGVYKNAALTAYVDRIGQALAKNAVRKGVKYTFTILDDDEINAFALPGGFVYITRGAINYANSEAEVAAILGHEIGHVDAFHFRRHGDDDDKINVVLSVLLRNSSQSPGDIEMAQRLAGDQSKDAAYSQDQEFEADALSVHYLTLAGYDPQAMVNALYTEDAKSKLDDGDMKGNPLAHDIFAMDQSHPATPEREARAAQAVKVEAAKNAVLVADASGQTGANPTDVGPTGAGPAGGKTDRDAYLAAVDGMTFGADPSVGVVDGHRLVNATEGFSFEAPEGFDLWAGHGGVFGVGRNAMLILETAEKDAAPESLMTYVQSSMMDKLSVTDVRPLEIDGYRGATGVVIGDLFVMRLGAVRDNGNHFYRLIYLTPRRAFQDLDTGFLSSLKSFHTLQGAEATPQSASHLRVITAAAGDTVQSLAQHMAVKENKVEWFRVLNGLEPGDAVKPGDKMKVVE